jgi:hypothetical protein
MQAAFMTAVVAGRPQFDWLCRVSEYSDCAA